MALFGRHDKGKVSYHFKAINETDYELELVAAVEGRIFNKIYSVIRKKLRRQKGTDLPNEININQFNVPEKFYNALKMGAGKCLANIERQVGEDGIILLSSSVTGAKYEKIPPNNNWDVKIVIQGLYSSEGVA